MIHGFYNCDACNQSFSMKWNADRHNKLIHGDLSVIDNKAIETNPGLQKKSINQNYKNNLKQSQSTGFIVK